MPSPVPSKFWHLLALLAFGLFVHVTEVLPKTVGKLVKGSQQNLHQFHRLSQIFLLAVPKRNREFIIGDLEEEYRTSNEPFPRLWYWGQVLALVGCYWWAALRRLARVDAIRKIIRK